MKYWNRLDFGKAFQEKQKPEELMEEIYSRIIKEGKTTHLIEEEGKLIHDLESQRKQDEILSHKKYNIKWYWEGENNTMFFHKAMVKHKNHNPIFSLTTMEGSRLSEHGDIEEE